MKKNLLMLFVALSAVLASCARKDVVKPDAGEKKSVYVKLSQGDGYAEGPSLPSGYIVSFATGYMFFTDAHNKVVNTIKIVSGVPGAGEISAVALTSGVTIPNVRSTATSVSVIGNLPAGVTVSTTGYTSEVFGDQKISLESQATLLNATLTGGGSIVSIDNVHSALVVISPRVSRIEITGVKALSPISNFKLVGIFVDNFYTHLPFNNVFKAADLKVVTAQDLMSGTPLTAYTSTPSMADFNSGGLGEFNDNVVAPSNGNVWGYTLFPSAVMPRIILRFKDITNGSGTDASTKYLTINGLKTTTGVPISYLTNGVLYKINASDLTFSEADLSGTPVLAPKQVAVNITSIPWSIQTAKPSYGVKK